MESNISPKTSQSLRIKFDVKKGDNLYTFEMPYQCPLGEAYDAVYEVLSDIVAMSNRAYEQSQREKQEEKKED